MKRLALAAALTCSAAPLFAQSTSTYSTFSSGTSTYSPAQQPQQSQKPPAYAAPASTPTTTAQAQPQPYSAPAPYQPPAPSTPVFAPPPMTPAAPPVTMPVMITTTTNYGVALAPNRGPWVIGDVRFEGNNTLPEYVLSSKVRAKRGSIYMPEDVQGDVDSLMQTGSFNSVKAAEYPMQGEPVPEGYKTIAVSTSMVRLVFFVAEKAGTGTIAQPLPGATTGQAKVPKELPPAPVSGVVLTPTAYRGLGKHNTPGLGLDFNAIYYIGRLYGKNSLDFTTHKTDYIDRIGQWFLSADGKMQLQSEGDWRPAAAVGAQGIFSFRDAPQPALATPGVTVKISQKTTRALADAYGVLSKKFGPVRSSIGYMQGNGNEMAGALSEYLSDQALLFGGHQGQSAKSKSAYFISFLAIPKPQYPLGIEFYKPTGMPLKPYLINFKIGYFLHLNFDVSYLKFAGGWDLLGNFAFRFNYFPSR